MVAASSSECVCVNVVRKQTRPTQLQIDLSEFFLDRLSHLERLYTCHDDDDDAPLLETAKTVLHCSVCGKAHAHSHIAPPGGQQFK